MAQLNEIIISEINGLDVDPKLKEFLKWLMQFERDIAEKEQPIYKPEIQKKLNQIFLSENTE